MALKLGCAVWTLMEPDYHAPYEPAIQKVADAGFEGIELMVDDAEELQTYWKKEQICKIREMLSDNHLELIQVCMFQNMVGGLADLRKEKKEQALENIRAVCRLAKELGTRTVNFTSPYPEEDITVKTTATLPEYFYLNLPGIVLPGGETRCVEGWRFDAKFRLYFPEGFCWEEYWENFIDSMKRAAEIAEEEDVCLRIENRYNTMTPHTDSVLRMLKRIESRRISVTFHTGQAFLQREILPWAVHRYGKAASCVRVCDGDGLACYNLPVGAGITYWEGVLEALKEVGYDGYLSFEWLNDADKEEHVRDSIDYLRRRMEKVYGEAMEGYSCV